MSYGHGLNFSSTKKATKKQPNWQRRAVISMRAGHRADREGVRIKTSVCMSARRERDR